MLRNNSKQSGQSMQWILKKKEAWLRWEGLTEKEDFKPGMKEWVGDGKKSKYDCWQIKTV